MVRGGLTTSSHHLLSSRTTTPISISIAPSSQPLCLVAADRTRLVFGGRGGCGLWVGGWMMDGW